MKFVINEVEWEIKEKTPNEVTECYNEGREDKATRVFGLTYYSQNEIWLADDLKEHQKKRTLIHELVHCWLWSYGHYFTESYNEELICDLVSAMNGFINKTVNDYFKTKEGVTMGCGGKKKGSGRRK